MQGVVRTMVGYVYILQSETSGGYYIGATQDVLNRLREHNAGETVSTKNKGPWVVRFTQVYENLNEAKRFERRLKALKRRDIIEQIIRDGNIKMR